MNKCYKCHDEISNNGGQIILFNSKDNNVNAEINACLCEKCCELLKNWVYTKPIITEPSAVENYILSVNIVCEDSNAKSLMGYHSERQFKIERWNILKPACGVKNYVLPAVMDLLESIDISELEPIFYKSYSEGKIVAFRFEINTSEDKKATAYIFNKRFDIKDFMQMTMSRLDPIFNIKDFKNLSKSELDDVWYRIQRVIITLLMTEEFDI